MEWHIFQDWFIGLGSQYGVNPIIFGAVYVGGIPFFTASVAWLIRNLKSGRPIQLPILSAGFFFISAYLYLIIFGENIPFWVYGFIVAMISYGIWATLRRIRAQTAMNPAQP